MSRLSLVVELQGTYKSMIPGLSTESELPRTGTKFKAKTIEGGSKKDPPNFKRQHDENFNREL